MDQWIEAHLAWAHSTGAVGAANMVGKEFDVANILLRVPEVGWGPFVLRSVGIVSRPAGIYEQNVSADMTQPIVGALGGNVLRHFRIDLDYGAGTAYLESENGSAASDLLCVGIVLQVMRNGTVVVSGVAQKNGRPEIIGVQAGDILLRVDQHDVTGSSLRAVLSYLSGTVGQKRHLTLRRGIEVFGIDAVVAHHP